MISSVKFYWEVIKETYAEWNRSSASRDAMSIAYCAIFSMPGLLIILIWLAGNFFGDEAVRGEISRQMSVALSPDAAKGIEEMIAGALIDKENIVMKTVGVLSLVFGATTLFFQLQKSLNDLWDVEAAPRKALVKFLLDRANSLALIFIIGLILMVTMILSGVLSFLSTFVVERFGLETYTLMQILNIVIGFALVMLIFAAMFKVLPDVVVRWRAVWAGALVTAVLFTLGKVLLSLYFGNFRPASAFGTAGTVVLIMLWINYSSMIIFFGAEFTKVYSEKKGFGILPSRHAKWKPARELQQIKQERAENI